MSETYLSKISLIDLIKLSGIRRYKDSAESRHRMVMALFPNDLGERPRETAGVLFRGERNLQESFVLIRSRLAPASLPQIQTIKESFENLHESELVKFRLTINPVKRKENKEFTIHDFDEIEDWVKAKISGCLSEVEIISVKDESIPRSLKGKRNFLKLVQIDGIARIDDSEELKRILVSGLGRGKSYGSGLITVRPL